MKKHENRDLIRWAVNHGGWAWFPTIGQIRLPNGGLVTLNDWENPPSWIILEIKKQKRNTA
jgi:hypothetical protein